LKVAEVKLDGEIEIIKFINTLERSKNFVLFECFRSFPGFRGSGFRQSR